MFALSTLTIFTIVLCFNSLLLGSLGLYLYGEATTRATDGSHARDAT